MEFKSAQQMPKVLEMTLANLLEEQKLYQWNINSNNNIVSVTLKFAMPGHDALFHNASYSSSTRRKSPAQLRRDSGRSVYWDTYNGQSQNYHDLHVIPESDLDQRCSGISSTINTGESVLSQAEHIGQYTSPEVSLISTQEQQVSMTLDHKHENTHDAEPESKQIQRHADVDSDDGTEEAIASTFDKVVIDPRSHLQYTKVIGIQPNKTVVTLDVSKPEDYFHVMRPDTHPESYDFMKYLVDTWPEARTSFCLWKTEIDKMYSEWDKHVKNQMSNSGIT